MYDYPTTHRLRLRHHELLEAAEHRRLVKEVQRANAQPNPVVLKLGEMLVEVGTRLQRHANPEEQPTNWSVDPQNL